MLQKTQIYKCRICGAWFHGDLVEECPDKDHIACYACADTVKENAKAYGCGLAESYDRVKNAMWGKGFDAPGD
jgi:DNA-directed RNA polymerase subunit RPC12/RpoP